MRFFRSKSVRIQFFSKKTKKIKKKKIALIMMYKSFCKCYLLGRMGFLGWRRRLHGRRRACPCVWMDCSRRDCRRNWSSLCSWPDDLWCCVSASPRRCLPQRRRLSFPSPPPPFSPKQKSRSVDEFNSFIELNCIFGMIVIELFIDMGLIAFFI